MGIGCEREVGLIGGSLDEFLVRFVFRYFSFIFMVGNFWLVVFIHCKWFLAVLTCLVL